MAQCAHCGSQKLTERPCPRCGAKENDTFDMAKESPVKCVGCGTMVKVLEPKCPACGGHEFDFR